MQICRRLEAKEVGLLISFTALYAYFSFIPAFRIIGLESKAITLAAITAPIVGIILGPYLGTLSAFLGGIVGFFAEHFSPLSFVSGIITAVFAGLLHTNKRSNCILIYFSLMFFFGFYPFVGSIWLYPPFMWFQLIGFLVLVSPLQSMASKNIHKSSNTSKLLCAFFIVFLTSTLAGQIAGSLVYELTISWPIFMADVNFWTGLWQLLTLIYPIERIIIALIATLIGVPLYKILMSTNLMQPFNHREHQKNA